VDLTKAVAVDVDVVDLAMTVTAGVLVEGELNLAGTRSTDSLTCG